MLSPGGEMRGLLIIEKHPLFVLVACDVGPSFARFDEATAPIVSTTGCTRAFDIDICILLTSGFEPLGDII